MNACRKKSLNFAALADESIRAQPALWITAVAFIMEVECVTSVINDEW